MKNIFSLFIITSVVLFSCKEVPVEIPEIPVFDSNKVVLLEELTGVSCSNCPPAALIAKNIQANLPGNVIIVGIHGDLLSEPLAESEYDFRFEEAKDLEGYLQFFWGKPAAAINRIPADDVEFSSSNPDLWQSLVEEQLESDPTMGITANVTFDDVTRLVEVNIGASPLVDLEGVYNVSVMLTENNIIDPQLTPTTKELDYKHEHVLRSMLTPFDGSQLAVDPVADEILNASFSGTLPAEDGSWIADNMEVVVFVHRVDAGNKEVLQAFSTHLTE